MHRPLHIYDICDTTGVKVWADAYLLAVAKVAGLKVVTFDRALHSRAAEIVVLCAVFSPTPIPALPMDRCLLEGLLHDILAGSL
jgi:hypothetical protein